MTTNEKRPLSSFSDSMQSQLCCGRIRLRPNCKATRQSECKLQFKRREGKKVEANVREGTQGREPEWLAKFTEFMQATEQPNVRSSSAAHSQYKIPSLEDQRTFVIHDQWQKAEPLYRERPNLKTDPLNSEGDTALHLAVRFNRTSFFKGLMDLMNPEDLEVQNKDEETAFYICAGLGNVEFGQAMLGTNSRLAMIKGGANGLFPIERAADCGHYQMLQLLCPATVLDDLDLWIKRKLLFTFLEKNIFDVACALLEQCPILAENEDSLVALRVLAQKTQQQFYEAPASCYWGHRLITGLWTAAKFMKPDFTYPGYKWWLRGQQQHMLLDAAKSGNILILDLVYQSNPELLMEIEEGSGRNIYHIAVLSQQENVLLHFMERRIPSDHLMLATDGHGNNILHLAGMLPPIERLGSSPPHIQMQRELLWFKKMENRVPTALKVTRNNEGLTPKDVFDREHAKLLVDEGVAAKDTANYGMLVATIIATIVFAASLTVPGHDVSPKADSSILQKKGWYIIFILSNTIALFSSSSSIIFFLSVLTSSWKEDAFIGSLHVRLLPFGVITLFLSTTAMAVAFVAASFLIFNHLSTWVAYIVASLGFLTVALLVLILYALSGDLIHSVYLSLNLLWLANYYQRIKSHTTDFIRMVKGLAMNIDYKFPKMCQIAKPKMHFQEDNPVAAP